MHEKKEKADTLEKKVQGPEEEPESKWEAMPLEVIERLFHNNTYVQFTKDLKETLKNLEKDNEGYITDGYISKAKVKSIADALMDKLAEKIAKMPDGMPKDKLEIDAIKAQLEGKGINYKNLRTQLRNLDFENDEAVKQFIGGIAGSTREFWEGRATSSLDQHYKDPEGRKKLKEHVERKSDVNFTAGDNYNLEHAIPLMRAYINNHPDVYDENLNVNEEYTKLADEVKASLGPDIVAGHEEILKKVNQKREKLDINKPKEPKKEYESSQPKYTKK